MPKQIKPLLVVDGYNLMMSGTRYQAIFDETNPRELDTDPFIRARERLVTDIAAYAQQKFESIVVFDGANNVSDSRKIESVAGVKVIYSRQGQSADQVIERLVNEARRADRDVTLVTSDRDIRSSAGQGPGRVEKFSSSLVTDEIVHIDSETKSYIAANRSNIHMTLESRLDPKTREKLNNLLNR